MGRCCLKRNSDLVFSVFIRSIGSMGMYIKHNKNRKHKTTTKKKKEQEKEQRNKGTKDDAAVLVMEKMTACFC